MDYPHGQLTNITGATTTVVSKKQGILLKVAVNTTAAGTITLYDNTAASGTKIATIKSSVAEQVFNYEGRCNIGLTVVTAAASDITVSFLPDKP